MKIINTNNQLEINQSGTGQIFTGIVFGIVGIGLVILAFVMNANSKAGQSFPIAPVIFGALFLIAGGLLTAFASNRRFVLERSGQTMVETKRVFGGSQKSQSFSTDTIVAVRLNTSQTQTTNSSVNEANSPTTSTTRQSTLSLLLNNNDIVEIARDSSSAGGINSIVSHAPLSKEAAQIAEFLGVPLDAQDSSSLLGAVKMIKTAAGEFMQPSPTAAPQPSAPAPPPVAATPMSPQSPTPGNPLPSNPALSSQFPPIQPPSQQ